MDINREYAAHQHAVMLAECTASNEERTAHLARASSIAGRISEFQHGFGAAAACAWSMAQFSVPGRT